MFDPASSRSPGKTDVTRRQLLAIAGGMSLAALLHTAPQAKAEDTADALRLATLATLLSAVACGPAAGMNDGIVDAYVESYATYRADADPFFGTYADAALDEIAATGIAQLDPPAALAELRAWADDASNAQRAAAALDLTHLAFEDDEARQVGYVLSVA